MAFAKEKLTVAIDISDGFAKVVAISADKGGRNLSVLDSTKLPSDTDKEIAREIRSLISRNKLGKSSLYVSFPRHLVTIRNIKLPALNEEEVENMAELQAIKYVPYSREEIVVTHKTIGVTKEGYSDILLILAQRKSVDRYVEIFKHVGVPIEKIALSSEGLLNWYGELGIDDRQPVAMIDLDTHHTHIQIIKNKKLFFSRSVSFDIVGQDRDRNALLREIRLSFDSFLKEQDERATRIILSGNEDYAGHLATFLADSLTMPCEQVKQLQNVKTKDIALKSLQQFNTASFTHLLGIALEPEKLAVDLLPRDIIDKRREKVLKNELIKSTALLLSVLIATFGVIEKKMHDKRVYLRRMNERLKTIEPEVTRLSKLKDNIELIQNQLRFEGSSIDIIRELYSILPTDVSLSLFEFEDKNRILLRGTANELSTVFNLLPVLEKSPYFENVKINYATKRTFQQKELADFEIICSLR